MYGGSRQFWAVPRPRAGRPLCQATLPWTYQEADVAAEALAQVRLLVLRRRQRLAGSGFVPRQSP